MAIFVRLLIFSLLAIVAWRLLTVDVDSVEARDISAEHDIVFFTAPWCGYCDQARDYLDDQGVDYLEVDVEASTANNRQFQEVNGRGVPLIFIGETRMAGFSPQAYGRALERIQ
ncbi:hypothetical protein IC757_03905 [Wenzhouxiangella sp. AB-CW3]|uniref:glutaredoxin family protein n=1 Tax=Wenzhouxiangella sp. AB-CW3 TaxID=2771012 RepID=UPI00168ABEB3|nr:glutaredoxin domain-containing protein [Wenzhouxiangella sp. AB-CW3]QOC23303.1 hypothetical protein IC757_03905 [Wenzhouxiangella sp. AB-CW3]